MEKPIMNYTPKSMSWADGFNGPKGNVGYFMDADENKAKLIIDQLIKDGRKINYVEMGLDGDWRENSDMIYSQNEFHSYNSHPSSCWAKPIIIVYFHDGPSEMYESWSRDEKSKVELKRPVNPR